MSWVGFEPTIPVFQRAKAVHALDSAATVIGVRIMGSLIMLLEQQLRAYKLIQIIKILQTDSHRS
jgi:hypothetical protein